MASQIQFSKTHIFLRNGGFALDNWALPSGRCEPDVANWMLWDWHALIVYPGCAPCSLCLPSCLAGRQRPSHLTEGLEGTGGAEGCGGTGGGRRHTNESGSPQCECVYRCVHCVDWRVKCVSQSDQRAGRTSAGGSASPAFVYSGSPPCIQPPRLAYTYHPKLTSGPSELRRNIRQTSTPTCSTNT
uniref:Uncharacterized protein n=1 Tax=Timema cristinae TaxID=61476 RepID=A0A7R9DF75_TIMCR|nr:unnamed protein product [Timema cristinae]